MKTTTQIKQAAPVHGIAHEPDTPTLELDNVWVGYNDTLAPGVGPRHALEGITFRVERGERAQEPGTLEDRGDSCGSGRAALRTVVGPPILAAPGMDEKALARAVAAELDRRERAKRSRVLSAMSDID